MAYQLDGNEVHRWLVAASNVQTAANELGFGKSDVGDGHLYLFDAVVTDSQLRAAARSLFKDGHFTESVRQALVCLDNAVQAKAGSSDTGAKLMQSVFSAKNPKLKLNAMNSTSEQDEQLGYMWLYSGAMTGIRNPRAHEATMSDDVKTAVEMLAFANHLMRKVGAASAP